MPKGYKKDPVFTPELMRVIKIFGLVSILIVVGLSFFNTRRANNTGKDQTFRMADSNRLYFLNVRALQYDREVRQDAGMNLYRHGKRSEYPDAASLDLVLILNPQKDEAYTYVEPVNTDWPIRIRIVSRGNTQEYTLENGDKNVHQKHQHLLGAEIREGSEFYIFEESDWKPFWNNPGELDYLQTLLDDYQELIN